MPWLEFRSAKCGQRGAAGRRCDPLAAPTSHQIWTLTGCDNVKNERPVHGGNLVRTPTGENGRGNTLHLVFNAKGREVTSQVLALLYPCAYLDSRHKLLPIRPPTFGNRRIGLGSPVSQRAELCMATEPGVPRSTSRRGTSRSGASNSCRSAKGPQNFSRKLVAEGSLTTLQKGSSSGQRGPAGRRVLGSWQVKAGWRL
jgi:hypothetical protein